MDRRRFDTFSKRSADSPARVSFTPQEGSRGQGCPRSFMNWPPVKKHGYEILLDIKQCLR